MTTTPDTPTGDPKTLAVLKEVSSTVLEDTARIMRQEFMKWAVRNPIQATDEFARGYVMAVGIVAGLAQTVKE